MPIPVQCACGQKFSAPDKLGGKRVQCPKCRQPMSIPEPRASNGHSGQEAAGQNAAQKIPVRCDCGRQFKAPAELAGRVVKCPGCAQPVHIPVAGRASSATASGKAAAPSSQHAAASSAHLTAAKRGPAHMDRALVAGLLDEVGVHESRTGARCPECRADLDPEAVLCVQCGYHLGKGKKLDTVLATARKQSRFSFSGKSSSTSGKSAPTPAVVSNLVKLLKVLAYLHIGIAVLVTLVPLYQIYQAKLGGGPLDLRALGLFAAMFLAPMWVGVGIGAGLYLLAASLLSQGSRKGRTLAIVLAVLSLFSVPIGTILGALMLRALFSPELKNWCK